jgi:hypothetical protein
LQDDLYEQITKEKKIYIDVFVGGGGGDMIPEKIYRDHRLSLRRPEY